MTERGETLECLRNGVLDLPDGRQVHPDKLQR